MIAERASSLVYRETDVPGNPLLRARPFDLNG
jgi:hypothetical protein